MKHLYQGITLLLLLIIQIGCNSENASNNQQGSEKEVILKSANGLYGFLCTAKPTDGDWYLTDENAPLFSGLGNLTYPVTTNNIDAQKYFDQGLILSYAFNHAEAARSFYTAIKKDTSCAMCYWGYAYVLGPNYNAGMEDDNYQRAYDAMQKAMQLAEAASQKEQDLIDVMSSRYTADPPENRYSLDSTYSKGLEILINKYPDDVNIAALYAESLMNMHPWDLWDKSGNPKEWTPSILKALEHVIKLDPEHPGGHHFYIHAVEASFEPQRGLNSAKVFENGLVPNSGHLMHMPSHIYIRTGDYHSGSLSNINAVAVDSAYTTTCHAQGAYPLAYYPHNYHFLSATATLEGNSRLALHAAEVTSRLSHKILMKEPGWGTLQHYYTIPYFVMVKFAKWNQILKKDEETVELVYPRAVRHYARGMAFLGIGEVEKAEYELKQLVEISSDEALEEITIWEINTATDLIAIAINVLEGEIAAKNLNYDTAIQKLTRAVEIEDSLNYNEPPDWFFSVRHNLATVLIEAGSLEDAIEVLQQDLKNFPENGWALSGLTRPYHDTEQELLWNEYKERFFRAWEHADVALKHSKVQ